MTRSPDSPAGGRPTRWPFPRLLVSGTARHRERPAMAASACMPGRQAAATRDEREYYNSAIGAIRSTPQSRTQAFHWGIAIPRWIVACINPGERARRCTGSMQVNDSTSRGDRTRVQELCRQLLQLVSLSQQQRQAIDRLVAELNALGRRVERQWHSVGSSEEQGGAAATSPSLRGPH